MNTIHQDCFFYKGSSPCGYHKLKGVVCDGCSYYKPIKIRIVIVKLGELGDVLRTTLILPALSNKYPNLAVTWITKRSILLLWVV